MTLPADLTPKTTTLYMWRNDDNYELIWVYWDNEIDIERLKADVTLTQVEVTEDEREHLTQLRLAKEAANRAYYELAESFAERAGI
jgi:hypothetical protein